MKAIAMSLHNAFSPLHSFASLMLAQRHWVAALALSLPLLFSSSVYAQSETVPDTIAQRVTACIACHGKEGRAGSDGYYPRIADKPAGYLYNQLINFRDGKRHYPIMTAMLANLSDAYLLEIAHYFADQHPPFPAPQPSRASSEELQRGQQLVHEGDRTHGIPACIACHGAKMTGIAPAIPGLIGLPRDYLLGQIGAWKIGVRKAGSPDCMAQIVQKMSPADISAVASWLAAQTVPADSAPAKASSNMVLPLDCGGVQQGAVK